MASNLKLPSLQPASPVVIQPNISNSVNPKLYNTPLGLQNASIDSISQFNNINEYEKCDNRWNSIYFMILIPIIISIVITVASMLLMPIFSTSMAVSTNFTIFILLPLTVIGMIGFNYWLYADRVKSIKKKCYDYGQNIIIQRTPFAKSL
jgi:hypothetical protein